MDAHDKAYNKIFRNKKLKWEEKLKRATEYANLQIKKKIDSREYTRFILSTGMMSINLN